MKVGKMVQKMAEPMADSTVEKWDPRQVDKRVDQSAGEKGETSVAWKAVPSVDRLATLVGSLVESKGCEMVGTMVSPKAA